MWHGVPFACQRHPIIAPPPPPSCATAPSRTPPPPKWTRSVRLDAPGQRHGATAPSLGRSTPGVVKQDKSSGGSVDTTKTRLDPQRVWLDIKREHVGELNNRKRMIQHANIS